HGITGMRARSIAPGWLCMASGMESSMTMRPPIMQAKARIFRPRSPALRDSSVSADALSETSYPASRTAWNMDSRRPAAGSNSTRAECVIRFTFALVTPGVSRKARSTWAWQAAQVIPSTPRVMACVSFSFNAGISGLHVGRVAGLGERGDGRRRVVGFNAGRADAYFLNLRTGDMLQCLGYAADTGSAVHTFYIQYDFAHSSSGLITLRSPFSYIRPSQASGLLMRLPLWTMQFSRRRG